MKRSLSKQARSLSDRLIRQINQGSCSIEQTIYAFQVPQNLYSQSVMERAATRFGRHLRAGKIHDSEEARVRWEKFKTEYSLLIGENYA